MKTVEEFDVFELSYCDRCEKRQNRFCHNIPCFLTPENKESILKCAEPWKNAFWETLQMLRAYAQELPELEFGPDEREEDGSIAEMTIVSKTTVEIVDTISSEMGIMGLVSPKEIEKFMQETR